jgi:chemotaxis protein MotB
MTLPMFLAFAAATVASTGCSSQEEKDHLTLLEQENTELRSQLDERDKALEAANGELRQANTLLRTQREDFEQQASDWQSKLDESSATAFDGIQGVTATYGPNDVTVAVEGDVLFDSGRTTLKPAAKKALQRVAQVLQGQYPGKPIIVAGHTDTDPIKKSGHKTNYHLGFERGWAVRNFLTNQGIDSGAIAVMSYGPDRPMGSSQQSRRVEIVVAQ